MKFILSHENIEGYARTIAGYRKEMEGHMTTQRERIGRASPGAAVPVAANFVENSSLAAPSAPHDTDVATLRQELAALRTEFAAFRTAQMSPATTPAAGAHGMADAAAEITKTPTTSVGAPTIATSITSRRSVLK